MMEGLEGISLDEISWTELKTDSVKVQCLV